MKEVVKRAVLGIGIAMLFFCISGIIFDINGGGTFTLTNYQFTKMVLGCIIVGIGFGVPTIVYDAENIPMPLRVLIHMGIGCIIYTIVAFNVGWVNASTPAQGIIVIGAQLLIAFITWFLFMRHYSAEAKKMNDRIQALK